MCRTIFCMGYGCSVILFLQQSTKPRYSFGASPKATLLSRSIMSNLDSSRRDFLRSAGAIACASPLSRIINQADRHHPYHRHHAHRTRPNPHHLHHHLQRPIPRPRPAPQTRPARHTRHPQRNTNNSTGTDNSSPPTPTEPPKKAHLSSHPRQPKNLLHPRPRRLPLLPPPGSARSRSRRRPIQRSGWPQHLE